MTGKKKKIVFITQSLDNTGSEILLFQFINFLADRYTISLICFKEGSLIKYLNKTVQVHMVNLSEPKSIFGKLIRRIRLHLTLPILFRNYKNDTWYINTIILPIPVKYAVKHHVRFILHSHELKHMYDLLDHEALHAILHQSELMIANSSITKSHLLEAGSTKSIEIIHPFIDLTYLRSFIRKTKNESEENFTWVMAGSIDSNKNPGLFVQIALEAKQQQLPYTFVWLYQTVTDQDLFYRVQEEVKSNQLAVQFIKTIDYQNYMECFSQGDGLLLTSTYESFSLVTLEALALNKALVLNNCGGVLEIVTSELAGIVPLKSDLHVYLLEMEKERLRNKELCEKMNGRAAAFDKHLALPQWEKLLAQLIKNN